MGKLMLVVIVFVGSALAQRPKPPQTVKIGMHVWTLSEEKSAVFSCGKEEGDIGCSDGGMLTIRYGKGLPLSRERDVIWHEIKHAIMYRSITNVQMSDEGCVEMGAEGEIEVLRDNPALRNYLFGF